MDHSTEAVLAAKGSTWSLNEYAIKHEWAGIGIVISQHRDSDVLDRSNWETVIEGMQEFPKQDWDIARLNHWAVGWVEYIVHNTDNDNISEYAVEIEKRINRYPVLDEELYSKMEWEENHPTEGYYAGKCLDPDCEHCELEKA